MTTTIACVATDSPALTEHAEAIGRTHGRNAATRATGGVDAATCQRILDGIEYGDGRHWVYSTYHAPELSGEYARADLMRDLGAKRLHRHDRDYLCALYGLAASSGFWDEIQRIARDHLA
jgi:hypothetical protein